MSSSSEILLLARTYSEEILTQKIPQEIVFHSLQHTKDVVEASLEIGKNSGLKEEELEILELAAWFHDLGYSETIQNHEQVSAQIAMDFLSRHHYDEEKILKVSGCILATKMPQSPKNLMEKSICDADLLHLGKSDFFEKTNLLRDELEKVQGEKIKRKKWMKNNVDFIQTHDFFTDYAKEKYANRKLENLKKIKHQIDTMKEDKKAQKLQQKVEELKEKVKEAKEIKPTRGIETMFRLTSRNHLELSAMADNKANIMISINALILSIIVSLLLRKLEEYPHLTVPALMLTIVCLVTIVFAILATRPNITKGKFTREDIKNKEANLLFFGNFHKMNFQDYTWAMKEMLQDADYLYGSLIKDIYYLGVVLGQKYRLLRITYTIFMFGFVLSVISFVIAEIFFKGPYPY